MYTFFLALLFLPASGQDLFLATQHLPSPVAQHAVNAVDPSEEILRSISKVFVVFSNHLDVGYTDYALVGGSSHSNRGCQAGTMWVGDVKGANVWLQHVSFDSHLTKVPSVHVKFLGGSTGGKITPGSPCCGDRFHISAQNATTTGFIFRVERTNPSSEGGWGQELLLGWSTDTGKCPFPLLPSSPPFGGIPVLTKYWYDFVPRASSTALLLSQLEGVKPEWEYKWMCHSFVFDMFLGCADAPDNVKPGTNHSLLKCPNAGQIAELEKAVTSGVVTWHAFPHNAEPEMYPPDFFLTAINRTHTLDKRFGRAPRRCLSQRDVPGLSRASIPLLRKAGVELVSVGENGAAGLGGSYDVPRIFLWEDLATKTDVIALFHKGGYGSFGSPADCAVVPEAGVALCPAWRDDNQGPHGPEEALDIFKRVQKSFPNAKVTASDAFEDFLDVVRPFKDALPRVSKELGDSWIYGASADPVKVATYRAALRERRACIADGRWTADGPGEDAFDRLLLKIGEHTWGDNAGECRGVSWENKAFAETLSRPSWGGRKCIDTWREQRNYVTNAVLELQRLGSSCSKGMTAAVEAARPPAAPFDLTGYTQVSNPVGKTFTASGTTIAFGATGGFTKLSRDGQDWATEKAPIAEFVYQTLDGSTMHQFVSNYSKGTRSSQDFDKPGLPDTLNLRPVAGVTRGNLKGLWRRDIEDGAVSLIAEVAMPDFEHLHRGAPATVTVQVNISGPAISLTMKLHGKTSTHIPETPWVAFRPALSKTSLRLDKMGSWIDPTDVLWNYNFSAPHLHVVDSGFRYAAGSHSLTVDTLDAGLVSVGVLMPTPYWHVVPDPSEGTFVSLLNNIWNTNYPQWFPFDGQHDPDKDLQYRFSITLA